MLSWALWICFPLAFWPLLFLMTSQLLILLEFPYKRHCFSLAVFMIFSMCFGFQHFYYDVFFFFFCGSGCFYHTWYSLCFLNVCISFFVKFENIQPLFLWKKFFFLSHSFLSLFWDFCCLQVCVLYGVPYFSEALFIFFFHPLYFLNCK